MCAYSLPNSLTQTHTKTMCDDVSMSVNAERLRRRKVGKASLTILSMWLPRKDYSDMYSDKFLLRKHCFKAFTFLLIPPMKRPQVTLLAFYYLLTRRETYK